ncbi:Na+/H+ antiporter NhaA [Streptomyces sp. NRRL S-813]|uniref:Na+/H+ antiporter NhaA n=1 Tax=Streptomyces sp. NRRL S-813 TaxID=1463919 RepID=UPI0007C648F8|nr:Na+/H+ antiporter NhaA [Streptomyces sp. NRRL S-813]
MTACQGSVNVPGMQQRERLRIVTAFDEEAVTATSPPASRTRRAADRAKALLSGESGGAAVLVAALLAALTWSNAFPALYRAAWGVQLSLGLGGSRLVLDLRTWIDNGLMTFFFLLVGLEARTELDLGELRERRRLLLPVGAGMMAMAIPVAIYLAVNHTGPSAHGWGVAMSTDSALALGIFSVMSRRLPGRIRTFLLALFVVDDLVALLVIATFYSHDIRPVPLAVAGASFAAILATRTLPVRRRGGLVIALGTAMWAGLMGSGVDPVVAGLAIGLVTSAYAPLRTDLERATGLVRLFREQPSPHRARSAVVGMVSALSDNARLQHRYHAWTTYGIVPLFALANGGITMNAGLLRGAASSPVTIGIFLAYVIGKPISIVVTSWAVARLSRGQLRPPVGWAAVAGSGAIAGIGFTVSLLIANLAFSGRLLEEAKIGILAAAAASAVLSWTVYRTTALLPQAARNRALIGSTPPLLDLVGGIDPARDHVRGPERAAVTVVEYGDYECPHCSEADPVTRDLLLSRPDVRYVWRHLPLSDVHPHARLAAEAAEAAAAQGAFWRMHALLLQHQDRLEMGDLLGYAADLGLDVRRFHRDLRRRAHAERVERDIISADRNGVSGTPTFFFNGQRHHGAHDLDALMHALDAALAGSEHSRLLAVPKEQFCVLRLVARRYRARGPRRLLRPHGLELKAAAAGTRPAPGHLRPVGHAGPGRRSDVIPVLRETDSSSSAV